MLFSPYADCSQLYFEVASVKRGGNVFSTKPDRSGGRIKWTTQLCCLIGYAYHLDFSRVSGPKCSSIYSVEATFSSATEANGWLSVAKGGLKIKEASGSGEPLSDETHSAATLPEAGVTAITGRKVSMRQIAETQQRVTSVPVWDRLVFRETTISHFASRRISVPI